MCHLADQAHAQLDRARVEHLFDLYEAAQAPLLPKPKARRAKPVKAPRNSTKP
jgi:hypothetical protein